MGYLSQLLFVRPSFIEGIARLWDFGNTLNEYNRCDTGEEADYRALMADWRSIGLDIWGTASRFSPSNLPPSDGSEEQG